MTDTELNVMAALAIICAGAILFEVLIFGVALRPTSVGTMNTH
jgi:hypothetical protein